MPQAPFLIDELEAQVKMLGFSGVGCIAVAPAETHQAYMLWLEKGYAGKMAYLHRHAWAKVHPQRLWKKAKTLLMLTHPQEQEPENPNPSLFQGKIARYAWGEDYHLVLRRKLEALSAYLVERLSFSPPPKILCDAHPLLEREFAARAGLGWVGKNAMLIHPEKGSYLTIAGLLLPIDLPKTSPKVFSSQAFSKLSGKEQSPENILPQLPQHCGSCRACLEACPTKAIVSPKTIDSQRCLSYHTIELKGSFPQDFRRSLGSWLLGCDICQQVCPWNKKAEKRQNEQEPTEKPASGLPSALPLRHVFELEQENFQKLYKNTSLERPKLVGVLRNAAIVGGNLLAQEKKMHKESLALVKSLERAKHHPEPLVQESAKWALEHRPL